MPTLSKILITQFRNYSFSSFDFKERIIGICGLNGKGKTNLLDVIYYLCFTKSFFSKTNTLNIQFGTDGFRLEGYFDPDKVVCIQRATGKKDLSLNDVPYEKYSQHIGKFPCVMIAPDDIELITGGSEERRRFVDTILSQLDANYLQQLIQYNKILQQRNSLLKLSAEQGKTDWELLDVLDKQLLAPGKYIHSKRKEHTERLIPLVQQFYKSIAANDETVLLQYESKLNNNNLELLLAQYRDRDLLSQRSNVGIHKDDINIFLNDQSFKNIASQGQRKSLLFALKLAEFEILKTAKGFAPLLLLDDVFEKLDDVRMQNLLHWVCKENTGQVFITDTHRERLELAFVSLHTPYQIIQL
ncbi:DNA replication/repair protein RecF [Ferruginibacter albus]|uniref:DNA replication/repair protein RecF n=1 Tax=Ferruginibacter albus TaxID=2875540 RepID=UPI001CC6BE8F|nr:DNA replication and repair protein RecF [Ferruginibacter albus]UAY50913.1 DNA replication and repair protein RecF [Ferruginibacter albus]